MYGYGLDGGFSSWYFQQDSNTQQSFQQAQVTANVKGDKLWEQILNGVVKYGDPFLTMLTKNGIIPNKNIQAVLKSQYDQNALAQLAAANGGNLYKDPNLITDRSAKILGMDTSTLVLIAAAIIIAMILKSNK